LIPRSLPFVFLFGWRRADSETAAAVRGASDDIAYNSSTAYNFSKAGRAYRAGRRSSVAKSTRPKAAPGSPTKMTPREHNKQELLKNMEESKERNRDFDYLFGGVLRQVFESAKGKGDFKGAVLSGIEQRLPSVYSLMDVDGDGGDAVDLSFTKYAKESDLAVLEDGLVGMLKAVGADVEDLDDVCLLRFLALNYGTINVEALTACVTAAICNECELDDVSCPRHGSSAACVLAAVCARFHRAFPAHGALGGGACASWFVWCNHVHHSPHMDTSVHASVSSSVAHAASL